MSISQAVYEAQIQRIADLQARLADLEAERELIVQRAENAEAALEEQGDVISQLRFDLAEADALLREARKWSMPPEIHTGIDAHLSRKEGET